jgi:PAS domain S-box-containing protein
MWSWFRKPIKQNSVDRKFEEYKTCQKDFFEIAHTTINLTRDISAKLSNKIDSYLKHIEATANILSDALIVIDHLGLVQRINPAGQKMFGWMQSELRGKRIVNLFTTSDGKSINYERFLEILDKEKCFDYNIIMDGTIANIKGCTKDKKLFDVDISASSYINNKEEETFILLIRDVTDSEILKHNLKKSEEHYKAIFETSFDAIAILKDFKVIECNKSFKSLFGSKNIKGIDFRKFIDDQYITQFELSHTRHINGEECSFEFELLCKKYDGKDINIIFSSTLVGADNEYASLITLKDITFRKMMENKHIESEQKYKNIFENTFNAVMVAQNFKIVAINKVFANVFNKSKDELLNTDIMIHIHQDSYQEVFDLHTRRMNGSTETHTYILKLLTPDGIKMFTASSTYALWNNKHASIFTITPLD